MPRRTCPPPDTLAAAISAALTAARVELAPRPSLLLPSNSVVDLSAPYSGRSAASPGRDRASGGASTADAREEAAGNPHIFSPLVALKGTKIRYDRGSRSMEREREAPAGVLPGSLLGV